MSTNKQITISKTVKDAVTGESKRVPTGVVLSVLVWTAQEIMEFSEAGMAWVDKAVEAAIMANARNAGAQDGLPSDILALITPAERTGGEGLKVHREFVAALIAFLKTTGRKQGVLAIWGAMAASAAAVATATKPAKDGLAVQVIAFAETLDADTAAKYEGSIMKLHNALTEDVTVEASDFE